MNLYNYICERYNFDNNEKATFLYKEYLNKEHFTILSKDYGFIIYKFEGDACIINDLYTTKEYRKTGKAWDLFKELMYIVNQNEKCKVLIGFSEHDGQNHANGQGAMLSAGFKPVQYLKDKIVFMRGI